MLVSKLFPSACRVPGAGTGWGITFSSPWESQESTLLPMLPGKGVSQADPRHPAPDPKQNPKQNPSGTLESVRAVPFKHRAWLLRDCKPHLLFHLFNGSRRKKPVSSHHCSGSPQHARQEEDRPAKNTRRCPSRCAPCRGRLPSLRAQSAASPGPPAFPIGAFRVKGRRWWSGRLREPCRLPTGGCKPQGLPILPAAPQQLLPGPIPPGDAVEHSWVLQAGLDAEAWGVSLPCSQGPQDHPKGLPAHLSWLQVPHRCQGGLTRQMGHRGLGNHPLDPAQHPPACG